MPRRRIVPLRVLAATAAALLAACESERATLLGPDARPIVSVSANAPTLVSALTRKLPLTEAITVQVRISRQGGSFAIPEAGLRVVVPKGAVASPTVFTATALAGDVVAYEFGPHGAVFEVPLRMIQDLKGTTWEKLADRSEMEAGYFRSESQLDQQTDQGYVDEFVPTVLDVSGPRLGFAVRHFSGYLVSSGRAQ